MKVYYCKGCVHYIRGKWSSSYKPLNYHVIGVSHAFGYCKKYKRRCIEVNKCEGVEPKPKEEIKKVGLKDV